MTICPCDKGDESWYELVGVGCSAASQAWGSYADSAFAFAFVQFQVVWRHAFYASEGQTTNPSDFRFRVIPPLEDTHERSVEDNRTNSYPSLGCLVPFIHLVCVYFNRQLGVHFAVQLKPAHLAR